MLNDNFNNRPKEASEISLTTLDIHNKEFSYKFRGYSEDEVNDFLDTIIRDYETFNKIIKDQQKVIRELRGNVNNNEDGLLNRVRNIEIHCWGHHKG